MLSALLLLETLVLLLVVWLLLRKAPAGAASVEATPDPLLVQLLAADLPGQMMRSEAHAQALERHLREELAQLRRDHAAEAARSREAADVGSASLRAEIVSSITKLGDTLHTGLDRFRGDNKGDAEKLRTAVDAQLETLRQRFGAFTTDTLQHHAQSREALHTRLTELGDAQTAHQEKLRGTVEQRLDQLNTANAAKLEEMRQTVDEKLHATLQTRLTESFGQVTDQLTKVHSGLGEMNTLSTGVQDLNRLFSNVKSRGGFAEVQLGNLLEQVLAPGQYIQNARVKKGSQEVVEYAVRFPGSEGQELLLPIDAKFPKEDWERLETAYDGGVPDLIEAARRDFERAIRIQAKKICEKYIHEPVTTPYAIMFLPTEGLYAEVLRRDGLQGDLHQTCKVMIAGPSNLYALLSSFQLGFRMINLQKKGNEVWTVLGEAKTEFGKFGVLMDKMEKKVGEVQGTLQDLGTRSRAINRKLRDVSEEAALTDGNPLLGKGFDGMLPMVAAGEDE